MTPIVGRPIEILLVEDNPGDVRLTQEAFRTGKVSNHLHANCYIAKPLGFAQFLRVVCNIESFWLTIVKLPTDTAV